MPLISCRDVAIAFGAETVLSGVDLRIEPRERLALVGANGTGKTSLLGVLIGSLAPAAGSVDRERRLRMAYLPQDAPPPQHENVLAEVVASRHDLGEMRGRLSVLETRLSNDHGEAVMAEYGAVQHAYEDAGGYLLEARAREALGGLGLSEGDMARDLGSLSGGQQRRVELAKLLVRDADLLLIDEPTNHLDLAAIEWLEEFMTGVATAFVVVSHDRRFLDRVCTSVVELSDGTAEAYVGNYSHYVRQRGERVVRRQKDFATQQAYITHQEEFIRRYKAGQRAKQARGRQTLLDRLDRVERPADIRRPRLRFAHTPGAHIALRTSQLSVGRDRELLTVPATTIEPGERIAIVGANGAGKSTLLATLAGELAPLAGTVTLGARTVRRLYRQDLGRDQIDGERTVLDDLLEAQPVGPERARSMLASLLFSGDDVDKTVDSLSGGERARLLMGKLALEETNLLLIDEPTNHLDIPAQEVLEDALLTYPGAVILVTHDRALIDALATRTWSLEDGHVREVLGGYTALLRVRERERQAAARAQAEVARSPAGRTVRPAAVGTKSGAAALRRLESEIAAHEQQLAALHAELLDPTTFSDPHHGAEVGLAHERVKAELDALYERWEASAQ